MVDEFDSEFVKNNPDAYREMRQAQHDRAGDDSAIDSNPDSAASMERHFARETREQVETGIMYRAYLRRDAERRSLSEMATLKGGGPKAIGMTAADIVSAGGAKKGGYTSIESGPGGIVAAGGKKKSPVLGMAISMDDQIAVAEWGSKMQAYRTAERQYRRRQQQKKKNDGGLEAARQRHSTRDYFPTRPLFTIGGVSYGTMTFSGVTPITGAYAACENGFPKNTYGEENGFGRHIMQAGRLSRKASFAA